MADRTSRIVVAGAGSIGCYVGGCLSLAGRNVTLLLRPALAEAIAQGGLLISDLDGADRTLSAAALALAVDPGRALAEAQVILVTVKSGATADMADLIARHAPVGAIVVSLQNGVGNLDTLRARLGASRSLVAGMVPFNVVQTCSGEQRPRFHRATSGTILIASGVPGLRDALDVAGATLAEHPDMTGVLWGKLILNLNNALNALAGVPLAEELADRRWRVLLAAQIDEALAVQKAAHIRAAGVEGVPPRVIPHILRLPDWLFRRVARRMLAIDPAARSSMWEDLLRSRPTEIDYLQGAILALADKTGVTTPMTRRIAHLIKDAESARAGSPALQPSQVPRVHNRARTGRSKMDADAIVVGGGLAGLVAAMELIEAGKRVILLDQEPEQSLGGQAFWSFGGLFFVDSPEQRRMRIRDSYDLALQDWLGSAGFDREEDALPRKWAEAYVAFAAGEKRAWLRAKGLRWFPIVGWAERGGYLATEHGNSVPRFHVTWGTGPGIIKPFAERMREGEKRGLVSLRFRHRVNGFTTTAGVVDGVRGDILEPSAVERGHASSRTVTDDFELKAQAIVVTSGGIGANLDLVRKAWPTRLGAPPSAMICGVPDHVDGRMLGITEAAGGNVINRDRMWHYTEGIQNWSPIWSRHGIRILPGPSSLWLDARGRRLPAPLFPGFDTLGTLAHIMQTGYDYSWFVLSQKIIEREFALSGSEQNPDLTSGKWAKVIRARRGGGAPAPVRAFMERGADFIVERNLPDLVARMNKLAGEDLLDAGAVEREIRARDREIDNAFTKDAQITAIRGARNYLGDKLIRVAKPHRLLDPAAGPLIAVRLWILTRKTLGGLQTDLSARVLQADGTPLGNVFAAGEVAGFGGGGMHGYRALEGTFLGGCIFSGRTAGRAAARV